MNMMFLRWEYKYIKGNNVAMKSGTVSTNDNLFCLDQFYLQYCYY